MKRAFLISLAAVGVAAAPAAADVVTEWNQETAAAIAAGNTPPPQAARAFAMVHLAIYDAVNAIDQTHEPFRVYTKAADGTSAEAAAAEAAYRVLLHLYPERAEPIKKLHARHLAAAGGARARSDGVALGRLVARQIIAWRASDGSRAEAPYAPVNRAGQWRPTPPENQAALLPGWSQVVPFAMSHASQFRPSDPPPLSSDAYARDFNEVKRLGAAASRDRTEEETAIAHFWADGPGTAGPPGHWNEIARAVAETQNTTLADHARLFALLNTALADAAIVCWDMKYTCNLWRPITAIREADQDDNPRTEPDPQWEPLLQTPPFPSCTSGHSTFSGAAAKVLASFFESDRIAFTSTSPDAAQSRSFASFSQAAAEAGRSRIYAGIHFEFDNYAGLSSGEALAEFVQANYFRPVENGPALGPVAEGPQRPSAGRAAVENGTTDESPSFGPLVTVLRPETESPEHDARRAAPSDEPKNGQPRTAESYRPAEGSQPNGGERSVYDPQRGEASPSDDSGEWRASTRTASPPPALAPIVCYVPMEPAPVSSLVGQPQAAAHVVTYQPLATYGPIVAETLPACVYLPETQPPAQGVTSYYPFDSWSALRPSTVYSPWSW